MERLYKDFRLTNLLNRTVLQAEELVREIKHGFLVLNGMDNLDRLFRFATDSHHKWQQFQGKLSSKYL
ncbi:MAG: hypothetical protein NWQ28_08505 [Nodularia sp. (in: cyanobacteria)]|nr:hypothetical protein [Nodularia sp. (in: cyanobacteria)]